ncbi:MAG: T9SS C-terminal target domain-containing protein [Bacteroidetes bacterium]|nr:MAG: T9SS C-terminal target domain-containing protein [Bacteroidota bacterium]
MAPKLSKTVFHLSAIMILALFQNFTSIPATHTSPDLEASKNLSENVIVDLNVTITSSTDVSCFLGDDGSATASASGGSGNYSYLWANGQTTATATGLSAGSHGITVTDLSNGDTGTATAVIGQPQPLNLTATVISDVTCADPTGTAIAVVSGGTTEYQYLWESGETTPTAMNLQSGIQTVTVTDANGCVTTDQFTVLADTDPPVAHAGNDLAQNCNHPGLQFTLDGSLSSQGEEFSYFWFTSNGNIVSGLTTLHPVVNELGTYTLLVTDASNGCTSSDEVVVYEDFEPPVADAGPSVSICKGDCHTLTASAVEGTPPYSYIWANGAGSGPTIEVCPLITTMYTVTVTGSNGCTSSDQVSVFVNETPSLDVYSIDCSMDQMTYTISVLTSGTTLTATQGFVSNQGSGIYHIEDISIDGGPVTITATIENTSCSTEVVVEPPVCGCPDIDAPESQGNVFICEDDPLVSLFAVAPEGMAVDWYAEAAGGTPLLSGSEEFLPQEVGTYFAESRDPETGCVSGERTQISISIKLPPEVTIFQDGNFCEGDCTILTAMGDQLTTYSWITGQTTSSIFVCDPGTYVVTATDIYGCYGEASIEVMPLATPTADAGPDGMLDCVNTEITIGGENSSTGPEIEYTWSNGASTLYQTISEPGEYFLTVVNTSTFCSDVDLVVVTQNADLPIVDAGEDTCISCVTGLTTLEVDPGPNLQVVWFFMDNIINSNPIFVSEPGQYIVEVTNLENGCSNTDTVFVDLCALPEIAVDSLSDVQCNGESNGSVYFSVSGGTPPYEFEGLDLDNPNLVAGTYTFSVTDANLCLSTTTVTIEEPGLLVLSTSVTAESGSGLNDGSASANASGGTPEYNFEWSNGETTSSITNLAPGTYTLTVTDSNGCTAETSVTVNSFDCMGMEFTISGTGIICPGSNAGLLQASDINGGTAPFTYEWSTGSTNPQISQLSGGIYSCTITDDNNCQSSVDFEISEEDNEPPVLNTQDIILYLDEGGQASFDLADIDIGSTDNCSIDSYFIETMQFTCEDVGENQVEVIVFDAANLSDTGMVVVTVVDEIVPTFISCPENIYSNSCSTVEYALPEAMDNCNVELVLTEGLPSGTVFPEGITQVIYSATDPFGNSETCMFTITLEHNLNAYVEASPFDCDALITATIVVAGGTPPYEYLWSTGSTDPQLSFIGSASVSWTVTDAEGCMVGDDLTISVPEALELEILTVPEQEMEGNGSADATISGGVPPYTFVWTIDGAVVASTEDIDNLNAGTYCLLVTDAMGCQITSCATVDQVTNLQDQELNEQINIAPNPVRNLLTIDFGSFGNELANLQLFNDKGQLVQSRNKGTSLKTMKLETSQIPEGLYFLKVIIDDRIVVKKIIVCR